MTNVESSWNVMAHGDAREGKRRGNWWMEWVASTLHTTSEHGVSSITTADVHNLAASSQLNWPLRRFKWTRPFRQKTKSGFCTCAITFQAQSISNHIHKSITPSLTSSSLTYFNNPSPYDDPPPKNGSLRTNFMADDSSHLLLTHNIL